jgi:hypothetical protein
VIANEAIIAQMDASLEAIEASDDPSPSIMFSDANLDEDALLDFAILDAGTDYDGDGVISATGGGGSGFSATYTVDLVTGALTGFTIVSNGAGYTTTPTLAVTGDSDMSGTDATFNNIDLGNALFANLTNDGQTSIDVDDMWVSADGDEPEKLSPDSYNAFGTFFPTETIAIIYLEGLNGLSSTVTSLTITADGAVATESNL